MHGDFLHHLLIESSRLLAVTPGRSWAIVLGVLAAVLTIALLIASRTKWGENKSLTTCVVLAVLAHVWLLMYAYGTRIMSPGIGPGKGSQTIYVDFVAPDADAWTPEEPFPSPEEPLVERPEEQELAAVTPPTETINADASQGLEAPSLLALETPALVTDPDEPLPEAAKEESEEGSQTSEVARETVPVEQPVDVAEVEPPSPLMVERETVEAPPVEAAPPTPRPVVPKVRSADQQRLPAAYQNRFADRLQLAKQYGGDESTEAAVQAGLQWLVRSQGANGGWEAQAYGAGRENHALGEDRMQAGRFADTGMTGLALLALLAAGHTHLEGEHALTVRHALAYLLAEQMDSGDLAGRKQVGAEGGIHFSRMYCHGMATFALAEAYALTGDTQLKECLDRAIAYTVRSQNSRTGGWRYRPGDDDPGDLSQFGWQAMALHSYRTGGGELPPGVSNKLATFLQLVEAGQAGGLATYRPNRMFRGQVPSTAMTAEAFACRLLLHQPTSAEARREAKGFLLKNVPSPNEINLYYWYYATMALFQLQDADWQAWNGALKSTLLATQRLEGEQMGSWDPNCVWGGYGGRVYSTALSCLCLEVYYRYLPILSAEQGSR